MCDARQRRVLLRSRQGVAPQLWGRAMEVKVAGATVSASKWGVQQLRMEPIGGNRIFRAN